MKKTDVIYIILGFSSMLVIGIPAASLAGIAHCYNKILAAEEKSLANKRIARTKMLDLKRQKIWEKIKKRL